MAERQSKGQKISKTDLARLTGKTFKTVDSWMARGLTEAAATKKGTQGTTWEFNSAKAIEWMIQDRIRQLAPDETPKETNSLNSQRAREAKERADRYALQNAVSKGELLPLGLVASYWGRMISAAKQQLRGIPSRAKVSGVLPKLTLQQSTGLLGLIDEALRELSSSGIPTGDLESLEEDDEDMEPAA